MKTRSLVVASVLAGAAGIVGASPTTSAHCSFSAGPSHGVHSPGYDPLLVPPIHLDGQSSPWVNSDAGDCEGGECTFNLGSCRDGGNCEFAVLASCTSETACYARAGWFWPEGLSGGFGTRHVLWAGADSSVCVDAATLDPYL